MIALTFFVQFACPGVVQPGSTAKSLKAPPGKAPKTIYPKSVLIPLWVLLGDLERFLDMMLGCLHPAWFAKYHVPTPRAMGPPLQLRRDAAVNQRAIAFSAVATGIQNMHDTRQHFRWFRQSNRLRSYLSGTPSGANAVYRF